MCERVCVCMYVYVCVCARALGGGGGRGARRGAQNKINYGEKNKVTEIAIRSSADARAPTKSRCDRE